MDYRRERRRRRNVGKLNPVDVIGKDAGKHLIYETDKGQSIVEGGMSSVHSMLRTTIGHKNETGKQDG